MKKTIFVSGANGFIGKNLVKSLESDYQIYKFKIPSNLENIQEHITSVMDSYQIDYFIHLNFVKKPKNKYENFLNLQLPILIIEYLLKNKNKCKFIYSSSINVFLNKCCDFYTQQKKLIESKINKYENVSIIRMPLIISNQFEGDKKKLASFVNFLPFISLIPYKGSKINYLDLLTLMNELKKIIDSNIDYRNYNLISDKYIYLYEIAKSVSQNRILLFLPIDIIFKYLFTNVSPAIRGLNYKKELIIKKINNNSSKNIYIK